MSFSPILLTLIGSMLVVIASGIALTRSGRPFSTSVLSVHKLVDLALLVAVGALIYRDAQVAPLSKVALTSVGFVAGLQVATLITGGVVTASESAPSWLGWTHRILSWLALLMTVWWGVLFLT